jgi:ABC-type antimicrobial peptide transport system permease subunit
MNDCFLNLLFSFQLLLPLKDGADFVGSKQTIDVILSDLSLLGYVIPVGDLVLDYLFAYLPILRQSIMSGFNLMKNIRLQ